MPERQVSRLTPGEWYIDDRCILNWSEQFGYSITVRAKTLRGSLFVADFGTSQHARYNARRLCEAKNGKKAKRLSAGKRAG